ncbi:MAG TPA: YfhO family protein, partial [Terriglobia bacterium]|nr:YfhO family protein [Terriglobia bacterium]
YLLTVNFCITLLAGLGIDDVFKIRDSNACPNKKLRWLFVIGLATACLLGLVFSLLSFETLWLSLHGIMIKGSQLVASLNEQTMIVGMEFVQSAARKGQLHSAFLLIFLSMVASRSIRSSLIQTGAAFFLIVDLFASNYWVNPLTLEDFYDTPPVANYILDQTNPHDPGRVYRFQDSDFEQLPDVLGATDSAIWVSLYRKLTLYQFLSAKDHIQFAVFGPIDRMETLPSQIITFELRNTKSLEDKLNYLTGLNVGYILSVEPIESPLVTLERVFHINSESPLRVYRLRNRLPRAFLVLEAKPSQENFQSFKSFLAVDPNVTRPIPSPSTSNPSRPTVGEVNVIQSLVQIQRYDPNQIEMESQSDKAGMLILLDSYFPGWHAFVDGKETQVKNINFVFRGVSLLSGAHHITLRYQPDSFKYGLRISSVGGFIWTVLFLAGVTDTYRRRLRHPVRL